MADPKQLLYVLVFGWIVRAIAVCPKRLIAVMTEDAKAIREMITIQPELEILNRSCRLVLVASAIDMIHRQKFTFRFSATSALASVMGKDNGRYALDIFSFIFAQIRSIICPPFFCLLSSISFLFRAQALARTSVDLRSFSGMRCSPHGHNTIKTTVLSVLAFCQKLFIALAAYLLMFWYPQTSRHILYLLYIVG